MIQRGRRSHARALLEAVEQTRAQHALGNWVGFFRAINRLAMAGHT
jgi:hypothetical protein